MERAKIPQTIIHDSCKAVFKQQVINANDSRIK